MCKKNASFLVVLFLVLISSCVSNNKEKEEIASGPLKVIFETDMGNDVDDAMALDMLYKYLDMDQIELLAIMINKNGEYPAIFADIMNTWYGYPDIPIGVVRDGADSEHEIGRASCRERV